MRTQPFQTLGVDLQMASATEGQRRPTPTWYANMGGHLMPFSMEFT